MDDKIFMLNASPSTTYDELLLPARLLLPSCPSRRSCPGLSDEDWVALGVQRVLEVCSSGRAFLQTHGVHWEHCPETSHYFHTLKSQRRLDLVQELNERLQAHLSEFLPDELEGYPQLAHFDIYAGDGHWHGAAAHDPRIEEKTHATGHFYALDLRRRTLRHLTVGEGRKEHDIHALKRLGSKVLRQGAPRGRKVLYVWDKAGIDFRFWYDLKHSSGIYFISLEKENMTLEPMGEHPWETNDPVNHGVLSDQLVGTSNGVPLRRIRCEAPDNGQSRVFITSEMTLPPGLIAHLYHRRWQIEKAFDSLKNKLMETKSWATHPVAKTAQAHFICLTHNLLRRIEVILATREQITNQPDERRRKERLNQQKQRTLDAGRLWPSTWDTLLKPVQFSVKLLRWLRSSISSKLPWHTALPRLRALYASL